MPDSIQKIQTAVLLGRRNQREAVPYLNAYFKSGGDLYRDEVKHTLITLRDERSVSVFSDIALNVSGDEDILSRFFALRCLEDIATPEAIETLSKLSKYKEMDIGEMACRAIHSIEAKKAGILKVDVKDIEDDLPGTVWGPVRLSAENRLEDNRLKDKIQELVDNKVVVPYDEMVKKETFWKNCFDSMNLSTEGIYFTLIKDPSCIFVKDGEIYPSHTGRSISINSGEVSYSIKYAGASVPFVNGALSLAYHDDGDVWFYGGKLIESGLTNEIISALSVEKVIDEAFLDPVLIAAQGLYGVGKDLFLTPMVQVEPLFMPVGIQKGFSKKDEKKLGNVYFRKGNLAFVPVKQGLELADVSLDEFPNSKLVMYIYKNSTGLDTRLSSLLGKEFDDEEWRYLFSSYGYEISLDDNGISFYKGRRAVSDKEVFNRIVKCTAARFACFLIVLQDYLNFSDNRDMGDTFTYQNVSPLVIFDYDTFGLEGYSEENMRHQIMGALNLIHELAGYFELRENDIQEADIVFREILTGEILKKHKSVDESAGEILGFKDPEKPSLDEPVSSLKHSRETRRGN